MFVTVAIYIYLVRPSYDGRSFLGNQYVTWYIIQA